MKVLSLVCWRSLASDWNRKCAERATSRDAGHHTKNTLCCCVGTADEKCDFHFLSFLVLLFAEPSRRKPSPWTLRSTAAWAAVRICPRSVLPSTPNDRFDPSSSRPSSPPRLPSTPKRHLEVRNAFLVTSRAWDLFCCDFAAACDDTKGTTRAQNESSHLNEDREKHTWAPLRCKEQSRHAVMAGGGVVLHTGGLIGECIIESGRH